MTYPEDVKLAVRVSALGYALSEPSELKRRQAGEAVAIDVEDLAVFIYAGPTPHDPVRTAKVAGVGKGVNLHAEWRQLVASSICICEKPIDAGCTQRIVAIIDDPTILKARNRKALIY